MNDVKFTPLTHKNWQSLEGLFGCNGACGGCWCMYWRLSEKLYQSGKGEVNRSKLKALAMGGEPIGIIAISGNKRVGWCAIAPRDKYARLQKSRILSPVDNNLVWSIVCIYIKKEYRKQGLSSQIIQASVEYACKKGAKIIEAYPVELQNKSYPDVFAFTGISSAFLKSGFKEVARRSPKRPIMRYSL